VPDINTLTYLLYYQPLLAPLTELLSFIVKRQTHLSQPVVAATCIYISDSHNGF